MTLVVNKMILFFFSATDFRIVDLCKLIYIHSICAYVSMYYQQIAIKGVISLDYLFRTNLQVLKQIKNKNQNEISCKFH